MSQNVFRQRILTGRAVIASHAVGPCCLCNSNQHHRIMLLCQWVSVNSSNSSHMKSGMLSSSSGGGGHYHRSVRNCFLEQVLEVVGLG